MAILCVDEYEYRSSAQADSLSTSTEQSTNQALDRSARSSVFLLALSHLLALGQCERSILGSQQMQGRKAVDRWTRAESDSNLDPVANSNDEDGSEFVSLEELGSVYARVLQGQDPTPSVAKSHRPEAQASIDFHGSIAIHGETDGVPVSLPSIIESLLFVGTRDGQAVSLDDLKVSLKEFPEEEILQGLEQLQTSLEAQNSSVRLTQDSEGYRLSLTSDLDALIEELKWGATKEVVLSQTAIDCLSIVAYQPGISRADLEDQLGQGVGSTLALLQRRELIKLDEDGFQTTQRFLEIAGIESLEDLPKADDL